MKMKSTVLLILALCFASIFLTRSDSMEQADMTDSGLFYVFSAGQIIIIDPSDNNVLRVIRSFNDDPTPFPNICSGSPFQGSWAGHTLGVGQKMLFSTAAYRAQAPNRLASLSDAVYVIDTSSQEVIAKIDLSDTPSRIAYVPLVEEMWVEKAGNGSFTVLSAMKPYSIIKETSSENINNVLAADGELLYDTNLGSIAYRTDARATGVYLIDLFNKETPAEFINFSKMKFEGKTVECRGTQGAAYSRINFHAFFSCLAPANTSIELDTVTNSIVNVWNFSAETMTITPDEAFLVALDPQTDSLHILGFNGDGKNTSRWASITFPEGSGPASIVFIPDNIRYSAIVAFTNYDQTADFDFSHFIGCGESCPPDNALSFIQFRDDLGTQNAPGKVRISSSRAMDAGNGFVCAIASYDNALNCVSTLSHNVVSFPNITGIQDVIFVRGQFNGTRPRPGNTSTILDCSSLPTAYPSPPPPPLLNPAPPILPSGSHREQPRVIAFSMIFLLNAFFMLI